MNELVAYKICISIILLLFFVLLYFVSIPCDYGIINNDNTTCTSSTLLGRKIYFHACLKHDVKVYDIRYFWSNEINVLKPDIIGVQLLESEFVKLCKMCK